MKRHLCCDCIWLSQRGNSVQNRSNCRQATTPTQRIDSEVIFTNKPKQWTANSSDLKSQHGCHCSHKYPPLNLNKLHLQCPRREKQTRPGYRESHAGRSKLVACSPTPLARHPQLQPWKAPMWTDRVVTHVLLHSDALLHRRLHRTTESQVPESFF